MRSARAPSYLRLLAAAASLAVLGAQPVTAQPAPSQTYADLARLPDFGGVWVPDVDDQNAQVDGNPAPWKPEVAAKIRQMQSDERAGRPFLVLQGCLPYGMPAWMLITHNAMEILYTPGRVTMLGEGDGNRMRRIYTDGRGHPEDPDLTFSGHSIGHWEGETLVVDTVGILPTSYIALSEAVGVPGNGDVHVVERIHLAGPDMLHDEMTITAPNVMTAPWKTTRVYHRARGPENDIVEGACEQGQFRQVRDAEGYYVFTPRPESEDGSLAGSPPN